MTPAEQLSQAKRRKRPPRHSAVARKAVWVCRVRQVREDLNLSLRDVADAVGMSITGLQQIELGENPMLTTARSLAAFFGMTTDELWPEKSSPQGVNDV